jgi:hypothetical protein
MKVRFTSVGDEFSQPLFFTSQSLHPRVVFLIFSVYVRGTGTYVNRMHTKCMGEMYGVSPRDRFRKFASLNCFREYFSDRFKTCANSGISHGSSKKVQIFWQLEIKPNFFTNFISISRTDIGTLNPIWLLGFILSNKSTFLA